MALIVQKYGGSSVADADKIRNVARRIIKTREAGNQVVVVVSAMGDTKALKARFGDRLTFWGGIDTQRVMPFGSTEDVRREVFKRVGDFTEGGGGYVLNPVHNILPEVPPQNVLAMIQAGKDYKLS